jgi:hypothetical protein
VILLRSRGLEKRSTTRFVPTFNTLEILNKFYLLLLQTDNLRYWHTRCIHPVITIYYSSRGGFYALSTLQRPHVR